MGGSCTQPNPECLAAQSNGAEHPGGQEEPPAASPHPSAGQELGKPWSFPMSHVCSWPRAQSTGGGHAQRRGLSSHIFIPASPGHRHHRHRRAAREGAGPSCSANHTRGKLVTPAAPWHFIITTQTALKPLPALRSWEQEAS